jgi:NADPH-dependent 2,4-dienoyl-CoA reductase/sulfur reductase-like enzyme
MHLVVIGNGVAGITAARHVRKLDPAARITVISDESDHFYARTALMYVYMGHLTRGHTKPYEDHFWPKNRIDLVRDRVERVDTPAKRLELRDGPPMTYDRLLVATGSIPRFAGWPGENLRGVQGLYGLPDLETMERDTRNVRRAVVVGGGLIGIELAEMLHTRGIHVTHLVREAHYHASVLPEEEGRMVEREIRRHGIDLRLETELREILGDAEGRVRVVATTRGEEIPAEFVGIAIGVAPNVAFLEGSGIDIDFGVLVDRQMRTSVPDVFAAGDCAQQHDPPPGCLPTEPIWYAARHQGAIAAHNICGSARTYLPGPFFNSAKFFTIEYQTYGRVPPRPAAGTESLYWVHADGRRSIRVVYEEGGGAVLGFIVMGIRYRHAVCEQWIRDRAPLPTVLRNLGAANFDPEFFDQFEGEVVAAYNERFPDHLIRLERRRGWGRWMSPDRRGLTGLEIPPGRALP